MEKIKIETVINSDSEKVWKHYTNPESIRGWAFASDDWECPYAENEVQVGGRFLTRMSAKDKSFGFDFSGTYTDVQIGKKLAYVMDKPENEAVARECTIYFEESGAGQTKVIIEFDPENMNPIEMQKNGWQSILNNFKKFVEIN